MIVSVVGIRSVPNTIEEIRLDGEFITAFEIDFCSVVIISETISGWQSCHWIFTPHNSPVLPKQSINIIREVLIACTWGAISDKLTIDASFFQTPAFMHSHCAAKTMSHNSDSSSREFTL